MSTTSTTLLQVDRSQQTGMIDHRLITADIQQAILQTLAYADVFDYAMTEREIHRYLIGVQAASQPIRKVLNNGHLVPRWFSRSADFFTLPGREGIVETRKQRTKSSASLWVKARFYGRLIAKLPFVRMVAVTGALAVNNSRSGDDIDYLIVTEPGRLWSCRAMVIALVRWAARRGDRICPNYFLSDRALIFYHRTLYTAHELVQMVPISGLAVYETMLRKNTWANRFLPNALGKPQEGQSVDQVDGAGKLTSLAETALRSPPGQWMESWEMQRKMHKFQGQRTEGAEISFCADWCKGHFDGHGEKTLSAYAERLGKLGIDVPYGNTQE
jgi:hypothetical protein